MIWYDMIWYVYIYIYMWMFPEIRVYPPIIHFNGIFHHKPTSLGYPHFMKPPYSVAKCINLPEATEHGSPWQAEESRGPSATLFRAPVGDWWVSAPESLATTRCHGYHSTVYGDTWRNMRILAKHILLSSITAIPEIFKPIWGDWMRGGTKGMLVTDLTLCPKEICSSPSLAPYICSAIQWKQENAVRFLRCLPRKSFHEYKVGWCWMDIKLQAATCYK